MKTPRARLIYFFSVSTTNCAYVTPGSILHLGSYWYHSGREHKDRWCLNINTQTGLTFISVYNGIFERFRFILFFTSNVLRPRHFFVYLYARFLSCTSYFSSRKQYMCLSYIYYGVP